MAATVAAADRLKRLLLVEDNPDTREALVRFFVLSGFDVVDACDGEEALLLLRGGLRPSVIVLDLAMPIMDGYAFREAQLADPALADIPVVVFSAMRPDPLPSAVTFVRKAADPGVLLSAVASAASPPLAS
jgi:CheY-like chemotaxis protein